MSKSSLILILIVLLVLSALGNFILLNKAVDFYKMLKIAHVKPLYTEYYTKQNKQLKWGSGQTKVLLFGDSRIKEWRNPPTLPDYQFVNRGISGETTAQMKARFESDILMLKPDLVIIQAGINDIVAAAQDKNITSSIIEQCVNNINYFINTLLQHNIKVILTTIIPPASPGISRWLVWDSAINTYVEQINQTWLASKRQGLMVLDTRSLLMNSKNEWLPNINRDTLHITKTGYTILNKAIINLLTDKPNAF